MKIAIIGSGNMGRALGVRLAQTGAEVFFGARKEPEAQAAAELAHHGAQYGTIAAAVDFANILLWTMREPDAAKVVGDIATLHAKIIIDLNNRDYATEAKTGAWFERSLAEQLQANLPGSHIVKAFNTIGMESFDISEQDLRASGAQTFLAGDDPAAKREVAVVAAQLGFEAVDLGAGPVAFRAAEALGDVIRLLMIDGGRGGQAHLKLTTLPKPTLGAIGLRQDSSYA